MLRCTTNKLRNCIRSFSNSPLKHTLNLNTQQVISTDRKTKIICTIGPATSNRQAINELLDLGMNAMRLNFSHGEHEQKREIIQYLRDELKRNRDGGNENVDWSDGSNEMFCSILADLKGPEIRTGTMSSKGVDSVRIKRGSHIVLTTNEDFKTSCDASRIYVDYADLANELQLDQIVFVDDGLIKLKVIALSPEKGEILCEAINSGILVCIHHSLTH